MQSRKKVVGIFELTSRFLEVAPEIAVNTRQEENLYQLGYETAMEKVRNLIEELRAK
jgi:hypothetical protein